MQNLKLKSILLTSLIASIAICCAFAPRAYLSFVLETCVGMSIDEDRHEELQASFREQNRHIVGIQSVTVPEYSSRPSAPKTLYLDLDGDDAVTWYQTSVPAVPAYDRDGNAASFSGAELTSIQEIWQRVSECFAPYNINVTTVNPGALQANTIGKIVIGGNSDWYGASAGGVAYLDSFYGEYVAFGVPLWGYAFPGNLGNGHPKYTADCICHEAGHMFGLNHQNTFSGTTKTAEYDVGANGRAPIMGASYYQSRALWWDGPIGYSNGSFTTQLDSSLLTAGISTSPDEAPSTINSATALTLVGNEASATGVIQALTDIDTYSIAVENGVLSLTLAPHTRNAMLRGALELVDGSDTTLALSAPANMANPAVSLQLATGTYYIKIYSQAVDKGDFGSFTLSATLTPNSVTPTATPIVTPTATGVATATATQTPTASPTPTQTPTSSPSPTPTQTPTPSATPTATPIPITTSPIITTPVQTPPTTTPTPVTTPAAVTITKPASNITTRAASITITAKLSNNVAYIRLGNGGRVKRASIRAQSTSYRSSVALKRGNNTIQLTAYSKDGKTLGRDSVVVKRR